MKPFLMIANIIGFCVLGAIYFFAFDLQWGITWQAVTFGLPLLAGMVFLVLDTIFMIKRQSWKRGLRGFGMGWAAFIYIGIFLWFFSFVLLEEPKNGPKETENTIENQILTQMLTNEQGEKCVNFVNSKTSNWNTVSLYEDNKIKAELISQLEEKQQQQDELLIQSVNMTFDRFVDKNHSSVLLTIKSSVKDGYYIDYDGKISRYFEEGGGGWMRLRLFRPCLGSSVDIATPAYDPEMGIVIVTIGFQADWLFGSGGIYILKLENGQLNFMAYHEIWVS